MGKTRQAVIAASIRAAGRPILVITLATLLINWQREIQQVYPSATVAIQQDNPEAQWILVNYEQLSPFVANASRFAVMVIDEAQRMKEPTAQCTRTTSTLRPGRRTATRLPARRCSTETELHTLLCLQAIPIGQLPLKEPCDRFAGNPEFRQSLRAELGDWMLRRRKDVLPSLKGKQRQLLKVASPPRNASNTTCCASRTDRPRADLGALRRYLETVKVRVAMDLLSELDAEDKVILFCEFKPTVAALKELCEQAGLGCVTLVGNDSLTKRQKAIDRFQQDPDCRVFICTTAAAGTGNNLTAANYVFFLGLPWTPGQQEQAEDRAYRNGQLRMVVVKIPLVEGTIDEQLWQLLNAKRQVAQDLIGARAGRRKPCAFGRLCRTLITRVEPAADRHSKTTAPNPISCCNTEEQEASSITTTRLFSRRCPKNEIRAALTDYRLQKKYGAASVAEDRGALRARTCRLSRAASKH
ncbi:DEAD/DEAH box helicase [Pseudomonas aeruginosa]|uniref:DEAD/DEAH box helicase n=1 Tax=Pseudomonas aeruginosa TaxID=287 RepID=UPI003D9B47A5